MGDEVSERDGGIRWIRLRATGQTGPFEFTLGDVEILAYVAENYRTMEMDEFVDSVVKTTDPFRQAEREGDLIPMELVDNTARREIGFDLERLAIAERQALEGNSVTLAQFANGHTKSSCLMMLKPISTSFSISLMTQSVPRFEKR